MKNILRKTVMTLALSAVSFGATAQDTATPLIKGYFRIQNVGNEKFVEVTGPFTAKPNLTQEQATQSAGTVMYVEAVQDGDSYRLTHLRCQGIDVVEAETIAPEDYQSTLQSIIDGGDPVYGLVREGFQYGYTSIARATVGTVFAIVASKLQNYVTGDDQTGNDGFQYYKGDYEEVAKDFNENVTASLDLGIRLKPVSFDNKTVQVYFDVPSLQPVCDWYLDTDAMLYASDPNPVSRHDVFASAMRAMTNYLSTKGINLETLLPQDVTLLESWNYDITATYPANTAGEVVLTFDQIFSDPILLFNWIKMVGYYILNPDKDPHNLDALGYSDLAGKIQNHYLTNLLVEFLPRLHYNTRAFLINGRVGTADTFGGSWDSSADGTLGFAGEYEVGNAGAHSQWALMPIDNDTQKFIVPLDKDTSLSEFQDTYNGFFFDFPVTAADASDVTFNTLGDVQTVTYTHIWNDQQTVESVYTMYYTELTSLGSSLDAQTPFILSSITRADEVQLNVGTGEYTFDALSPTAPEQPDNSFVIGGDDDETVEQHSMEGELQLLADTDYEGNDDPAWDTPSAEVVSSGSMRGVLLETAYNSDALQKYWDIDPSHLAYRFVSTHFGKNDHLGFTNDDSTPVAANTVLYVSPVKINYDLLLIGKPSEEDVITGVDNVVTDHGNAVDNAFYTLQGVRVVNPLPGNVYIFNGKKILVH